MHADAEATEIVPAFQYDRVFEEIQTNGTRELFPQVVSSCSSGSHVDKPKAAQHFRSWKWKLEEEGGRKAASFVVRHIPP